MLSIFCSPSRYVQGRDATAQLGDQLKHLGLGGPAFIVASKGTQERLSLRWALTLGDAQIEHTLFTFGGECSRSEIDKGTLAAKSVNAQIVIGVGGGKALDTSRAIAATWTCPW